MDKGYGSAPFSIHPVDYQGRERPLLKNSRTAEMSIKRKITIQNSMSAIENYEFSWEAAIH
jgi:hypothetical protein